MLTSAEIDQRLYEYYGEVDWSAATGLVHVAAIESAGGAVIVPGPAAPASPIDQFVLGMARARADAIVTSGAILRSEPELQHDLAVTGEDDRAWFSWRRERLGKTTAPLLIVLSASGRFPVEHPAIAHAVGGFVWTSEAGARRLRARCGERLGKLEIIEGANSPDGIFRMLAQAHARPGVETILLEAGPTVSSALYTPATPATPTTPATPSRPTLGSPRTMGCDELLLNAFAGELDERAVGPAFVSASAIEAHFSDAPHVARVRDSSGEWTVARYRNANASYR